MGKRRIGLALGGGVARGLAHIGILKGLEELDIKIHYIAGTSSGSIIGALYAAGLSVNKMIDIAVHASWRDLIHLVVPRLSLVGAQKMEEYLRDILENKKFIDLEIPFTAISTDLITAKSYAFTDGDVAKAVTASCSIPGIFPPVEHDGRLLVDGGLTQNVPSQAVRKMGADIIISVDLYASHASVLQPNNIFMVLLRSFEIMQGNRGQLTNNLAEDISLAPNLSGENLMDLNNHKEYIDCGYHTVLENKEQILARLRY